MAGVAAVLAVVTLAVVVAGSDERASGIVVPGLASAGPTTISVPSLTPATQVVATEVTAVSTFQQPPQPSSHRQQVTTTSQPPAKPAAAPAPAPKRFDPSASFRIVNVVNSLVLDSGGQVQPGTPMKLWEPTSPSTNLQFQLIETDGGYYRLVNRTNGLAVDGRTATTAGSWVGQRWWDANHALQWLPTEVGTGLFTLTNRATGFLLDGAGRGKQMGDQVKQWPPTGSQNQFWRIVRV